MIGKLILAKEFGHNFWWPAKIISEDDEDVDKSLLKKKNSNFNSTIVYFLGTHHQAWVKENHIKDFSYSGLDSSIIPEQLIEYFELAFKEVNQLNNNNKNNNSKNYQQQQQSESEYSKQKDNDERDIYIDGQDYDDEDDVDQHFDYTRNNSNRNNNNDRYKNNNNNNNNNNNYNNNNHNENVDERKQYYKQQQHHHQHHQQQNRNKHHEEDERYNQNQHDNDYEEEDRQLNRNSNNNSSGSKRQRDSSPSSIPSSPLIQSKSDQIRREEIHLQPTIDEDEDESNDSGELRIDNKESADEMDDSQDDINTNKNNNNTNNINKSIDHDDEEFELVSNQPIKRKKSIDGTQDYNDIQKQQSIDQQQLPNKQNKDGGSDTNKNTSPTSNSSNGNNNNNNNAIPPTSPSLSSAKRVLLIKPPRSPAINSRPNKPSVIIGNQNNCSSPSITQIAKPMNSPSCRSTTHISSPPPILNKMCTMMPSSPGLQSKIIPSNVMTALMQKKNSSQSPVLLSSPTGMMKSMQQPQPFNLNQQSQQQPTQQQSQQQQQQNKGLSSPLISSSSPANVNKSPITISIPRFKKQPNTPNMSSSSNTSSSPSLLSSNANNTGGNNLNNMPILPPQMMSPLSSSSIPFQIPQQQFRKNNLFPPSPSMNRNGSNLRGIPASPLGMNSQQDQQQQQKLNTVEEDESKGSPPSNSPTNNQPQTPMMNQQQPFPMFPFFSGNVPGLPPFNLNSPISMETTFSSPFTGKFAIKGSMDFGFQIECNIMGKNFQGFLGDPSMNMNMNPQVAAFFQQQQAQQQQAQPQAQQQPPLNMFNPIPFYNGQMPMKAPFVNNVHRRNSVSTAEGLSHHQMEYPNYANMQNWIESYKQWQDIVQKSTQQQIAAQHLFAQQQAAAAANGSNSNKDKDQPLNSSSSTSTPMQTPKTGPHIIVNSINKKDEPNNTTTTTTSTSPTNTTSSTTTSTKLLSVPENVSENPEFLSFKQNAFQKLEQYQKIQIINLLSKQEEAISSLLESFEKEKLVAQQDTNNSDIVTKLQNKFKDDQEKLQLSHKDQRAKLDGTHQYQAIKFHNEVEKQWLIQRNNKNSKSSLSPVGSPALTPFISPSPSPSPLLSSYIGNSPLNTPSHSMLLKQHQLHHPIHHNNNHQQQQHHSLNNSSGSNNNSSNASTNTANTSSNASAVSTTNSSGGGAPPPLSLSSNSPPRSPTDKLVIPSNSISSLLKDGSDNQNCTENNNNIKSDNHHQTEKELEKEKEHEKEKEKESSLIQKQKDIEMKDSSLLQEV